MRTLESLIKAKGGWNKVSTKNEYRGIIDFVINDSKLEDAAEIRDAEDAFENLIEAVEHAYKQCKHEFAEFDPSMVPLCLVTTTIIYSVTHLKGESNAIAISKNAEAIIKELKQKGQKALSKRLSYRWMCTMNDSFVWSESPETPMFWNELTDTMNLAANGYIKSTKKLYTPDTYNDFTDVHPEFKDEIDKFCKELKKIF